MPVKRKFSGTARRFGKLTTAVGRKMKVRRIGAQRTLARVPRMTASGLSRRNCHSYTRHATATYRDLCQGLEQDGAISFTFDDIAGYTDFSNLYDRYMITGIQLRIRLLNNPNSSQYLNTNNAAYNTPNTTNWWPRMYYIKDYDDDTAETAANLKERAKTKLIVLQPNRYYKIFIKPSVLMQTYRTSTTTGYSPKWNNWIDMAQANVPHYGFKYAFDTSGQDPADAQGFRFEIEKKYYFKCKDVR